ncbi:MAG: FkbM family methyltransferase [Mucilaginibacter sp.]
MLRTIKFILEHPLTKHRPVRALLGFLKWQLVSRLSKAPIVYKFTPNSKLWVWNGLTGATGNVYCGLHEFEDMAFLLHFLRETDLFVDIGANIGSYTMLASAEIGVRTIAMEPVPATYQNLVNNIRLNNITNRVKALNIGVGSGKGSLKFSKMFDTGNHVLADESAEFVLVDVEDLDSILSSECPSLLKIDVEGYETEVLNGAEHVLQSESLKAVIIELNGAGKRYGFDDNDVHLKLTANGFSTYKYLPFERKIVEAERNQEHNTLYIRDVSFVSQRLKEGKVLNVKGVTF